MASLVMALVPSTSTTLPVRVQRATSSAVLTVEPLMGAEVTWTMQECGVMEVWLLNVDGTVYIDQKSISKTQPSGHYRKGTQSNKVVF